MKLKSSIPSNSVKLIDLYNKIISDALVTGPDYQRKLVWKKQHKYAFIETILLNFPFPEIYIASSDVDLEELKTKEVVVDGQQRLTTIVDYIQGRNDFESQKRVKPFDDLSPEEKREFLNYSVTVKDLKDIGQENIIEVFKRINSTNYALNSNETLNAVYGSGEFAIFCKLLADEEYYPSIYETAIDITEEERGFVNIFFKGNNVFSENDIKRMFDSQYLMLISATLLEGSYFSRSSKINYYLEKYNEDFGSYKEILDILIDSIKLLNSLNLSENSYWFNKANLFSLIIEFNKVDTTAIDFNLLEFGLLDLENKMDVYFTGDEEDVKLLSADEAKYFEVARQGSHELQAREHRAKVIANILEKSIKKNEPAVAIPNLSKNIKTLIEKEIPYTLLIPTMTGLAKSIMDATSVVRVFLKSNGVHDYDSQSYGPANKKKIDAYFVNGDNTRKTTEVSMYRSNGRGDFRIWFSGLKEFAEAEENLIILVDEGSNLLVLNGSKFDYSDFFKADQGKIKSYNLE